MGEIILLETFKFLFILRVFSEYLLVAGPSYVGNKTEKNQVCTQKEVK